MWLSVNSVCELWLWTLWTVHRRSPRWIYSFLLLASFKPFLISFSNSQISQTNWNFAKQWQRMPFYLSKKQTATKKNQTAFLWFKWMMHRFPIFSHKHGNHGRVTPCAVTKAARFRMIGEMPARSSDLRSVVSFHAAKLIMAIAFCSLEVRYVQTPRSDQCRQASTANHRALESRRTIHHCPPTSGSGSLSNWWRISNNSGESSARLGCEPQPSCSWRNQRKPSPSNGNLAPSSEGKPNYLAQLLTWTHQTTHQRSAHRSMQDLGGGRNLAREWCCWKLQRSRQLFQPEASRQLLSSFSCQLALPHPI